jgi:large subunit ribosomal protein L18
MRAKIHGTHDRPRLCVSRSLKHIYAQLIDDEKAKVLLSVSDRDLKLKKIKKMDAAKEVGKLIAKKAISKKIEKVVFDRHGFSFHGRVKALADGAREGGLKF